MGSYAYVGDGGIIAVEEERIVSHSAVRREGSREGLHVVEVFQLMK